MAPGYPHVFYRELQGQIWTRRKDTMIIEVADFSSLRSDLKTSHMMKGEGVEIDTVIEKEG